MKPSKSQALQSGTQALYLTHEDLIAKQLEKNNEKRILEEKKEIDGKQRDLDKAEGEDKKKTEEEDR